MKSQSSQGNKSSTPLQPCHPNTVVARASELSCPAGQRPIQCIPKQAGRDVTYACGTNDVYTFVPRLNFRSSNMK